MILESVLLIYIFHFARINSKNLLMRIIDKFLKYVLIDHICISIIKEQLNILL